MVKILHFWLECARCGEQLPFGPHFNGCPRCDAAGQWYPLEVAYDYDALRSEALPLFSGCRLRSFWEFAPLLPLPPGAEPVSLGEGNTPLVRSRRAGPAAGLPNLYFKYEGANPTGAHKDRFHAVASTVARALAFRGVTTVSTGNHGAAAAAYASAAGLSAVVYCPPETSDLLQALIRLYGGDVVVADWAEREGLMNQRLAEGGWAPSTVLDAGGGHANPYGMEGYKTLAYELFLELGRVPERVLIPCAIGDTVAGVWKGFKELRRLGIADRVPRIYACQPAGANVLERTLAAGMTDRVVRIDHPYSVATSTREPTSGRHALRSVIESGGGAPSVPDSEILAAVVDLGREGLCVEAASALPLACARALVARGEIDPAETVVCVVTSFGAKWPDRLLEMDRTRAASGADT